MVALVVVRALTVAEGETRRGDVVSYEEEGACHYPIFRLVSSSRALCRAKVVFPIAFPVFLDALPIGPDVPYPVGYPKVAVGHQVTRGAAGPPGVPVHDGRVVYPGLHVGRADYRVDCRVAALVYHVALARGYEAAAGAVQNAAVRLVVGMGAGPGAV